MTAIALVAADRAAAAAARPALVDGHARQPAEGPCANWRRSPSASRCRERLANDPRIKVTAFEARHHVRYTADTLALREGARPGVDFVWIMGADNLRDFHRWQRWQAIASLMPIAVIDRPGSTLVLPSAPAP